MAKVGDLKVAWSRELPAEPSSVTVVKTVTGKYYASFVVAVDDGAELLEPLGDPDAETGIDLGLKSFAVLRGGKVIESPKFLRTMERRLKKARRSLSRRQRGGKNRQKARPALARLHEKARNQRDDWLNKQVKALVSENRALYVEELHVAGPAKSRMAKSVQDAAFGMFLSRLEAKTRRAGRTFVKIDRYFPSTRLCSACGALTGPKGLDGLGIRRWECGAFHDRDANAEIDIRREGRRLVAAGHADT